MREDTSSSIVEKDTNQDPTDDFANLRAELARWKTELRSSDGEIGKALGLSRQFINQFMRWNNNKSEDKTAKQTLPISRQKLISLWEYVTSEAQIRKTKTETAKENRRKLRVQTAHNLLEISGFLGLNRQSVVGNDLSKLEKFDRIIFRLSNKTLTSSDIWKIEETVINQLAQLTSTSQEEDKKKDSKKNLDDIKKWLEARYDNIDAPWRAVESTLQKYQDSGRKEFKESEILELFQNVSENQRVREDSFPNIRVTHCEIKTINSIHARLSDLKRYKESPVLEEILREGISIERILRGMKHENKEQKLSFNFINEIKLTCRLGNNKEEITWFYRSCSSTIDNIISAIKQGIGHDLELKDLSSHVLAEGSDSIVRVSAILNNDEGDCYTGRWVDIDTILSFAQAIIIAAENWTKYKITTVEERKVHEEICYEFAGILNEVDMLMAKTYEYGLSYLKESSVKDVVNNTDEDTTIQQFEKQIEKIDRILDNLEIGNYQSTIYSDHISVLREIKYQVQLAESRFYHVVGDVVKAGIVIRDIEEKRRNDLRENFFDISNILSRSAYMTQKFYTSDADFFDDKLWIEDLKRIEIDIRKYLTRGKGVKSLTDSLYRALAELYGNVGRFEFYDCEPYKSQVPRLENALKLSKRAVYFAMKTDDEKRVSHWLARCGRILCRLNKSLEASAYLDASERILTRSTISQYQYKERTEALMLEVNIAKGERCLLDDESEKSIGYFVDAFLGAIYLRFARIVAGSLYGMYRASQSTDVDISKVLKKLISLNNKNKKISSEEEITDDQRRGSKLIKSYKSLQEIINEMSEEDKKESSKEIKNMAVKANCQSIELFYDSVEILKRAIDNEDMSGNQNLPSQLKKQAISIWDSWVITSEGDLDPQHSISTHMHNGTFLGVIK
jgi:hypothetical protein